MKKIPILVVTLLMFSILFLPCIALSATKTEIIEKRTEYNKIYQLGKNTYALEAHTNVIHYKDNYKDEKSQWLDIDTNIGEKGIITKAPYTLTIDASNLSFTMFDKKTNKTSTITLDSIAGIKTGINNHYEITKNTVTYKDIATDVDLEISAYNTAVSYSWIIKSNKAPHNVTFDIQDGGIPIKYQATDALGTFIVTTTSRVQNLVTESIPKNIGIYPIKINPIIDVQVGAGTNDGVIYGANFSSTLTHLYAGNSGGTQYSAWFRFTGISGLAGATITTAYFSKYNEDDDIGTPLTNIYADDSASPTNPTDYTTFVGKTMTTSVVSYNTPVVVGWHNSPEIKTIIQELTDSYGASIDSISIFNKNNSSGTDNLARYASYEFISGTYSPILYIEYTTLTIPTVTTGNTTSIGTTTAICSGNITATGGENPTIRGVEYGTSTNNYTSNQTYTGNWSIGTFSANLTALIPETTYYWRAIAVNSAGKSYGAEKSFSMEAISTLGPPTNFTLTQVGINSVNASWTKDVSADTTVIVINTFMYPNSSLGNYFGSNTTGTSYLFTGLSLDTHTYYFSAWSQNNISYSEAYVIAKIGGETLLQLGVITIGIALVLTAFFFRRGLMWAIPLVYHGIAFYYAYQNSWDSFWFVPLGGFAIISLLVFNLKMIKGDVI